MGWDERVNQRELRIMKVNPGHRKFLIDPNDVSLPFGHTRLWLIGTINETIPQDRLNQLKFVVVIAIRNTMCSPEILRRSNLCVAFWELGCGNYYFLNGNIF